MSFLNLLIDCISFLLTCALLFSKFVAFELFSIFEYFVIFLLLTIFFIGHFLFGLRLSFCCMISAKLAVFSSNFFGT